MIFRYENVDMQKKVKSIYENELKDETWRTVDATLSKEDLQNEIRKIADEIARNVDGEVKSLWTR